MTLKQAKVELTFKDEQIEDLVRQNEELDRKTEELRQQIELLQRRLYGPRSERYHPDQLFLDNLLKEAQSQALDPLEPSIPVTATLRRKARPHGRMKIPDHIERVDELLDLPDEQKNDPDTGQALVTLPDGIPERGAGKPFPTTGMPTWGATPGAPATAPSRSPSNAPKETARSIVSPEYRLGPPSDA